MVKPVRMTQLAFGFVRPEGTQRDGVTSQRRRSPRRPLDQLSFLEPPIQRAQERSVDSRGAVQPARPRIHPTIRGQVRVEEVLRAELGPRVVVILTDNRSTMISFRRRGVALYVRAHAMFGEAPKAVLVALAHFVSRDRLSKRSARLLDEWIESHRVHLTSTRRSAVRLQPRGEIHDLTEIFDLLNGEYFGGEIRADITWGVSRRGQKRTTINMGTYSDELRLIRIHPALDQSFVPRYFVESVVYHEMLHQVHDVKEGKSRRSVHSRAFLADERRFRAYDRARKWEKLNLSRLLRY